MKIVVFGATGGTGREIVQQALEVGHAVTAFARSPDKLRGIEHEQLTVHQGDVLDPQPVEQAIAGQEAVLSALGAGAQRSNLREAGTRNIIEAMQKQGVPRLISLSSMGVGESAGNLTLFLKYVIVPLFLKKAFEDHERQEALVRQSGLQWTLVRPPHLIDGPRTGNYQHGFPATERNLKFTISRADVADFMLKQLADERYIHQSPGVSY